MSQSTRHMQLLDKCHLRVLCGDVWAERQGTCTRESSPGSTTKPSSSRRQLLSCIHLSGHQRCINVICKRASHRVRNHPLTFNCSAVLLPTHRSKPMPKPEDSAEKVQKEAAPASTEDARGPSDAAPQPERPTTASAPDEDDDDDETCGFCIFMKAGGCKDVFKDWSKCVDSERTRGGDFASDCREQTYALRECMLKHRDYYAPVLEEEADFVVDKEEAAKS